jgi:hypothetical protein
MDEGAGEEDEDRQLFTETVLETINTSLTEDEGLTVPVDEREDVDIAVNENQVSLVFKEEDLTFSLDLDNGYVIESAPEGYTLFPILPEDSELLEDDSFDLYSYFDGDIVMASDWVLNAAYRKLEDETLPVEGEGSEFQGEPAPEAPVASRRSLRQNRQIKSGRGNWTPANPWRETGEYAMLYIDFPEYTDADQYQMDIEDLLSEITNICERAGADYTVDKEWLNRDLNIIAEGESTLVGVADNQSTLALVFLPKEINWDYVNYEQEEELKAQNGGVAPDFKDTTEYKAIAEKAIAKLKATFPTALSVRTGAWTSTRLK